MQKDATILLYGLEPELENELVQVLGRYHVKPCHSDDLDEIADARMVFCSAVGGPLRSLLALTRKLPSPPPVVVVSRLKEECRELDAQEAGAQGYFAAPFDSLRVGNILSATLQLA
jgi:DNA-binding response OmpR family regulator